MISFERQKASVACSGGLIDATLCHSAGALSEASVRPSVRLTVPRSCSSKWWILELRLLYNTNRKPHDGSRTHWSASLYGHQKWPKRHSGRKKYVINISKSKREREPRLLLNVNRKSQAAYPLPWSSASHNHWTGPKIAIGGSILLLPPSGWYASSVLCHTLPGKVLQWGGCKAVTGLATFSARIVIYLMLIRRAGT